MRSCVWLLVVYIFGSDWNPAMDNKINNKVDDPQYLLDHGFLTGGSMNP